MRERKAYNIVELARRALPLCLLALMPLAAAAQDEPEYRAEIGGAIGMASYQGDLNGNLLKNLQPMASLVARYRMNPRSSWALNISYGKLKGAVADVATYYPELQGSDFQFSHALVDAGVRYEYNFWPYGTGREYRGARRLTPYIALGIGATYVNASKSVFTANIPLGAGIKYKVADRVNLSLEWAMHFTLSDELDDVRDAYGIKSTGAFKNTDCYSALQLSISYDIWAKCRTCHNDRE